MQAVTAAGVTKDAEWIANLHEEMMLDITGGDPYRLLGFLMDNTKANRAAMRRLEAMYPHLLNVGCQAHGMSLLVKDIHRILTGGSNTNYFTDAQTVADITQPIMDAIHTIEADKPLQSQMLPMYDSLAAHLDKVHAEGSAAVKRLKLPQLFADRKAKLWVPSFSAAYLLDPIYFTQDPSGVWWLPFTKLSAEQQAEAKKCIMSLTPVANQAAAAMEWDSMLLDGLPKSITGEVMQLLTERKQQGGKVTVAPVSRRQNWWCNYASSTFPQLSAAALRVLSMPVTTGAAERNWSTWGQVYTKLRNRLAIRRGEMIVFIRQNLKLQGGATLTEDEDIAMQLALERAEEE